MTRHFHLTLSARRLFWQLTLIVYLLCCFHVAVMYINYSVEELPWELRALFDLDEEESFGTWFSGGILFFAGAVLLHYSREVREYRLGWWFLGLGFCLLSLDEIVGFHEILNSNTDYSWTVPGAILVAVVGCAYIPFLWHLPPRTRWWFVFAGLLYLGGVIGVEHATLWHEEEGLLDTLEYNLSTALEEGMEMMGVVVFIYALLIHITGEEQSVEVDIEVGG